MALPAPLFVSTSDLLKSRLRLSGLPADQDGEALVSIEMQTARTTIYRRLGISRVSTLLGYVDTETPQTEEQILRSVAGQTETLLVLVGLLEKMPVTFQDGTPDTLQRWNEEGAFNDRSAKQKEDLIGRLNSQIEDNFKTLEDGLDPENEGSIQASLIEPATAPAKPWGSIGWNP